jgi:phosphate/sulfate permease
MKSLREKVPNMPAMSSQLSFTVVWYQPTQSLGTPVGTSEGIVATVGGIGRFPDE